MGHRRVRRSRQSLVGTRPRVRRESRVYPNQDMTGHQGAPRRGRAVLFAASLSVVATAALGPSAGASASFTFGANLKATAVDEGGCPLDSFFFVKGGPSCIIGSSSIISLFPGVSGVVTTVRVKTGDFPQGSGRMQVVVERAFKQNVADNPGHPNFFCCFIQQYGPVFTPRRNTINVIKTHLGLVDQPTPAPNDFTTVAKEDFLTLSVFGSNVPLPVGRLPPLAALGFLAYATPAPTPTLVPAPSLDPYGGVTNGEVQGLMPLMNATITPVR